MANMSDEAKQILDKIMSQTQGYNMAKINTLVAGTDDPITMAEIYQALTALARGAPSRAKFADLVLACGVEYGALSAMSDRDLHTFHASVAKRPESGPSMAARVNQSYAASRHTRPAEPVVYEPPKATPLALPDDDERLRQMIAEVIRPPVERIQEALRASTDAQDERIAGVTNAVMEIGQTVREIVDVHVKQALDAMTPTTLSVSVNNAPPVALGIVHRDTDKILKAVAAGLNVYLHGPAGSGKTTVGRKIAAAMSLPFYFAAKVESEYLLLGFKDAKGDAVRTQFREAYEHGGVFLFDELDGSSPSAVVALNAALANGICPFPDGTIERHADFHCIAAGNTVLSGANRQYVGRQQLDAASIDRFAFIEFGYDEQMELALADNKQWALHVQDIRARVAMRGIPHLVTPRATLDGCKALAAGFTWEEAEAMHVYKGLDQSTVDQIKATGVL